MKRCNIIYFLQSNYLAQIEVGNIINAGANTARLPQFSICEESESLGENMSKRLGGIIGCKYKTSSWHLNGFPCAVVTLGQQYNVGEKPTVVLYTYINRHAGTSEKQRKHKHCSTSSNMVVIIYLVLLHNRL